MFRILSSITYETDKSQERRETKNIVSGQIFHFQIFQIFENFEIYYQCKQMFLSSYQNIIYQLLVITALISYS